MTDTFPRQQARTRRFTLGVPAVVPDLPRRRPGGVPAQQGRRRPGHLPVGARRGHRRGAPGRRPGRARPRQRGQTERRRPAGSGPASRPPASSRSPPTRGCGLAAFAPGRAGVRRGPDRRDGAAPVRDRTRRPPAADPRPDPAGPAGRLRAARGALRVDRPGRRRRTPRSSAPGQDEAEVSVRAGRVRRRRGDGPDRGYWWAPDGTALLVARVDERPVQRWYIADPANPGQPAAEVALPGRRARPTPRSRWCWPAWTAAGAGRLGPGRVPVPGHRELGRRAGAAAGRGADPRPARDAAAGRRPGDRARPRCCARTPTRTGWTSCPACPPGPPTAGSSGPRTPAARGGCSWPPRRTDRWRRAAGHPGRRCRCGRCSASTATPCCSPRRRPTRPRSASGRTADGRAGRGGPRLHRQRTGGTAAVHDRRPASAGHTVRRAGAGTRAAAGSGAPADGHAIASLAERPLLPEPAAGHASPPASAAIRTALLLPSWHRPGSARLPVLMDPYGGPHGQQVLAGQAALPDLAVVRRAGLRRGGRGRPRHAGPRARLGARGAPATSPARSLEDQVDGAAGGRGADAPTWTWTGSAIRGWSFGGYLAALAVLRRPDVFHAAVAGRAGHRLAAVRHPLHRAVPGPPGHRPRRTTTPARCWPTRAELTRPLLLIHGLADDNVVVAHTLRLSSALLAAGRPHEVLPLSGVTHMTRRSRWPRTCCCSSSTSCARRSASRRPGAPGDPGPRPGSGHRAGRAAHRAAERDHRRARGAGGADHADRGQRHQDRRHRDRARPAHRNADAERRPGDRQRVREDRRDHANRRAWRDRDAGPAHRHPEHVPRGRRAGQLHALAARERGPGHDQPGRGRDQRRVPVGLRRRPVTEEHVFAALRGATAGPVEEGAVGAGTGTSALGFKAGIGTSSRVVDCGAPPGGSRSACWSKPTSAAR